MPSAASPGIVKADNMGGKQKVRSLASATSEPAKRKGGNAAFRLLEHTADMGIEARASSCEELFVQAARGMLAVLAGQADSTAPPKKITLEVRAGDVEELLVVWLNELLYLIQSKGLWPRDIVLSGMQPDLLEARLTVAPLAGVPQREIKAVTYHHLLVSCCHGLWRGRVYLDL